MALTDFQHRWALLRFWPRPWPWVPPPRPSRFTLKCRTHHPSVTCGSFAGHRGLNYLKSQPCIDKPPPTRRWTTNTSFGKGPALNGSNTHRERLPSGDGQDQPSLTVQGEPGPGLGQLNLRLVIPTPSVSSCLFFSPESSFFLVVFTSACPEGHRFLRLLGLPSLELLGTLPRPSLRAFHPGLQRLRGKREPPTAAPSVLREEGVLRSPPAPERDSFNPGDGKSPHHHPLSTRCGVKQRRLLKSHG